MTVEIQTFFDQQTSTFSHVVSDQTTQKAAVIDAVLNYDQFSGHSHTTSVDEIVYYIESKQLSVEWILDTHIHADHITGTQTIHDKLGGHIGIGEHIIDVLTYWTPIFNTNNDTDLKGSQFDALFTDGHVFKLGEVDINVIYTPGHTPACISYLIEDAIFVGDTLFMPDIGTARTDFPGGSAAMMYDSVQKILALPESTRIFHCHDYPPTDRPIQWVSTVADHKKHNVMVRDGISKDEYIQMRHARDKGKAVPQMLLPSIQANLRAGTFGQVEKNGTKYIKIPVDRL